ncbi:MAG: hypothetical protein UR93_C0023G0021 [Berkelbacteria bacterium GW2011_GWA2_35_9]|uniref:Uncharacterized protein n=1 Tax=Berkelbacteria bacterium GW2011_GWA2_35_9 TaxID=1618333 RepID=A0A0G0G8L4_9BACT|nr:MAG: hypothetical protein UR93_C0023G0021 [Berkelbacteria bacterium GW2011_GWA2_35_9]
MDQNTNDSMENAQTNYPDQLSNIDKPKTKTKLLWWVLGIIVLAGVAYGAYYYTNQNAKIKDQNDISKLKDTEIETPVTVTL